MAHYKQWVKTCLKKNTEEKYLKEELSTEKMSFLSEGIAFKQILQPQLLVKDHEERNEEGDFPTRLVILTTNFTTAFLKMRYMTIQKVLDDTDVNYNKHTIIQSSDLKKKLEVLILTKGNTALMSLDIEN
eukprot:6583038-Ditylum_brightwellii.AAC.1